MCYTERLWTQLCPELRFKVVWVALLKYRFNFVVSNVSYKITTDLAAFLILDLFVLLKHVLQENTNTPQFLGMDKKRNVIK